MRSLPLHVGYTTACIIEIVIEFMMLKLMNILNDLLGVQVMDNHNI